MIRIILTSLFIALVVPAGAFAANTSVTNTISVSASSGGNSASGGTVIESDAETNVYVHTEVNGEVIEHVETTGDYSSSFESEDGAVHVETVISTDTDNTVEVTATSEESRMETEEESNTDIKTKENVVVEVEPSTEVALPAESHSIVSTVRNAVQSIFTYVFTLFA